MTRRTIKSANSGLTAVSLIVLLRASSRSTAHRSNRERSLSDGLLAHSISPEPVPRIVRYLKIFGFWLSVILPFTNLAATDSPLTWRWSNPRAHGNNIAAMAYGEGYVIQVAERGRIYTSVDLDHWVPQESQTTNALRSVTFFKSKIVITGEKGTVLVADSVRQLSRLHHVDLGTADWLEGVAASSEIVVAVGDNGAIYSSTDALNWQRRPQRITTWLRSVTFGNGIFVAVGESGLILTSANGIDWQPQNSGVTEHLNQVIRTQNQFIIVGESGRALSSGEGTNWQAVNTGAVASLSTVAASPHGVAVAGDGELRLWENGTWNDQTRVTHSFPAPKWTYSSSLWDGTLFLLGGRSGMLVEGFRTNASSPMLWIDRNGALRNWLWDAARPSDFYIAVGDRATVMTSDDGIRWNLELVPTSLTNTVFLGVGGTTNLYFVVGNKGAMMRSANGVIWEAVATPTENDLQGISAGAGQFVATGGNGTILTSTDGRAWTSRASGTSAFLSSVAAMPSGWVAVGSMGTILTSPDGAAWTRRVSGTTNWIYRVRSFGNRVIAVGQNGTILTSANGIDWTAQSSGTTRWLNDIARVGDRYFIAGNQGTVLQSQDAAQWAPAGTITQKSLFALATDGRQLIATGLEGAILRSQVIPDARPIVIQSFSRAGGKNVFLFSGQADQRFTLDQSADFKNWSSQTDLEFLDGSSACLHVEDAANTGSVQFYRASLR